MEINKFTINVETITPVHVGSGNNLKGNYEYLYFPNEKVMAIIDPKKILIKIGIDNIGNWISAIDKEQNLLESLPILRTATSKEIGKRIISIHKKAPNYKNDIKEQIHLGEDKPTVPGSSLKGAIRTAILTKLIQDEPYFVQEKKHLGSQKGNYLKFHDKQVNAHYLGKEDRSNRFGELQPSPNKDLLRFLRIGDLYFDKNTTVVKNNIINLYRHGWGEKSNESSYYEAIPMGANAKGIIQIPKDLIRRVQEKNYIKKNFDLIENPTRMFKIINTHTLKLIDREIGFWEDQDNPIAIGDYLDELQRVETIAKNVDEKSCVIRVGANSGWEFMTGGWANGTDNIGDFILDDNIWIELKRQLRRGRYDDDLSFPKTRKVIEGGMPLGFVKLSLI